LQLDILLYTVFLGQPLWLWFTFMGIVNKADHEICATESLKRSAL